MATLVRTYTGGNAGATSVATSASSPAGAPAAGNLLVAFVGYRTVTGVTVTASGWTTQTAVANGTVGGHRILSKASDGTETATMTFQLAASVKAAVVVLEFSNASATLKNVVAGAVNSTAIAAHTGSAVAAPLTSDIVLFFDHNTVSDAATVSSNASATPTTGWTNNSSGVSTGGSATTRNRVVSSQITGRTASTTPSITWSATVTGTKQQLQIQNAFLPNIPASVTTASQGAIGFVASWAAGAIDSSHDAPTSYLLDVATDSGFTSMVSGFNGLDVGAVTSYAVLGLSPNTQYYWRVRATNAGGTSANVAPSPTSITTNAAPSDAYGAAVVATANLIGYQRLGEASGNAIDVAIGRTGTYPGSGVTRAQTGIVAGAGSDKATIFAGTGNRVDLGDVYDFTGVAAYTLEAWIYPTTVDTTYRRVLSKGSGSDGYNIVHQSVDGLYSNRWSSATNNTPHTSPLIANTLYHVAVTYDGSTLRLFVNGAEVGTGATTTGTIADSAVTFQIGGEGGVGEFIGTIDEVAIYNAALSSTVIASHYSTGTAAGSTTPVNADLQLAWHVRALVNQDKQLAWHVRAAVAQTKQLAWNVRTSVAQTKQLAWHVRSIAGQSQQSSWNVRALVTQSKQLSWHVRTIIAKTQQLAWHVRAIVFREQQTSWNVLSTVLTAGQNLQLAWHVRSLVSAQQASSWHTRSAVARTQQASWHIRSIVAQSKQAAWDVRALAGRSQQVAWHIREIVASEQPIAWHTRSLVFRELQASWNVFHVVVFVPVGRDLAIAWHVRATVGKDQQLAWDVLAGVLIVGAWGEFSDRIARGRTKRGTNVAGMLKETEHRVTVSKTEIKGSFDG